MASSQSELQLWVNLATGLRPLEQLALIGLSQRDPYLQPSTIDPSRIVGEEKCYRASQWLSQNVRSLLHCYCDFCSQAGSKVGGKASDTMSLVGALASLLMATYGYSAAPAVAFASWALQSGMKLWCDQYGVVRLDGSGSYRLNLYANYEGDHPVTLSSVDIPGIFSMSYYPAIKEVIRDKQYKSPVHQVLIQEPARAKGQFMPADAKKIYDVMEYCESKHQHQFSFSDIRSKRTLSGTVDVYCLQALSTELELEASTVELRGA
ncbi:hypothetical protein PL263_12660 [Methylomonas sp. EFPC3]|uniref:hypothetical protein n=1 Tax=Methylomonas sp. EFPC3 TaxID=3021710 RepID=UPI0024164C09|nr:hypothetical protein [Methylomonas sp. EFPC3]WFP48958.1 hypothetical protein PL263_12660 [Methylomonas sp. EFPC3]